MAETFSWEDAAGPTSAASAAPAAPAAFSWDDATKPATPPPATAAWAPASLPAPRNLEPGEYGYQPGGTAQTNLSREDLARVMGGDTGKPTVPMQTSVDNFGRPTPGSPVVDVAAPAPPPRQQTGVMANIGAGTADAAAGLLGAPVDAATWALNLVPRGVNAVAGTNIPLIQNPVGGSDGFRTAFGALGADPRNTVPADQTEQIARAAGSGAASMLLPFGAARAIPALGGAAGAIQGALGSGTAAGQAATGAVAGAAGQVAENAVPEPYKPLANFAGQLVGGAVPAVAWPLAGAAGRAVGRYVEPIGALRPERPILDPDTGAVLATATPGQARLAGQQIATGATDLPALRDTIENPRERVPGERPSVYALSGDQGIGQMERAARTRDPAAFIQRSNENTAAQNAVLARLDPGTASPEAVGQFFRDQMAALDRLHDGHVASAAATARNAVTAMGGNVPAGTAGQEQSALQRYGTAFRSDLAARQMAEKQRVGALWQAIDPEGTLRVDMRPIRQGAGEIERGRSVNDAPMQGDEAGLFATARDLPAEQGTPDLLALRKRITNTMRDARPDPSRAEEYRRLTLLLGHVDQVASGAVAGRVAEEAVVRRSGVVDERQAMIDSINRWADGQAAAAGESAATGTRDGGGAGSFRGSGAPSNAGASGAAREARGRSGGSAGNPSLPGQAQPVGAPYDAEAAARYQAARAGTAELKTTFQDAPGVGPALARGARDGEFRHPDSSVPAFLFSGGKGAAERVQAFLNAGGNRAALADYAAFDLRRAAARDGTLDPRKYDQWLKSNSEAMTAFPELRARFETASAARTAMDDAAARQTQAREEFHTRAVKAVMGDADPVRRIGAVLSSPTGRADMAELARRTANDPDARAGLKAAVVAYMRQELLSNNLAGNTGATELLSDKYHNFVARAKPALQQVMTAPQVEAIENLAASLQRNNRSIQGSKLPGGPGTAQDLSLVNGHGHGGGGSAISQLVGIELLEKAAGHVGQIAGFGKLILDRMRAAGLTRVDQLVDQAMLDPQLMRSLLAEVRGNSGDAMLADTIGKRLLALSGQAGVSSERREPAPLPRRPGAGMLATPLGAPRVRDFVGVR